MQATISGVTHNKFYQKKDVENFFNNEKIKFKNFTEINYVLYNKDAMVKDSALNYLNIQPENDLEEALKNLILKEYYECEKVYPYLGDYFLYKFFNINCAKKSKIRFSKREKNKFIKTLDNDMSKNIMNWIFDNTSLKRSVNVNKHSGKDVVIEMINDFIFQVDYDFDFFNNISGKSIKNYNFILINGFIESVSEVHHLLYKANENKIPYVIFCFGMSEEVKNTIIKNNKENRFFVYPVCLNVNDENNINILNDFAVIQKGNVVSSDLGQTISQEVSKDLKRGKEITFFRNKIAIKPCINKKEIELHRNFLKKRIDDAVIKANVKMEPLKNRLKMFTSERMNIYIPEYEIKNSKKNRELDYCFNFLKNLNLNFSIFLINDQKFYIPSIYINIVNDKITSLKNKIQEIHFVIV